MENKCLESMKILMELMDTGSKRVQLTEMKTNSYLSKLMQGHTAQLYFLYVKGSELAPESELVINWSNALQLFWKLPIIQKACKA